MHDENRATINPYLTFNGNCREAMNFYKEALNGEAEIITFEDSPMKVPAGHEYKVMHARVIFEGAIIMASDGMPDSEVNHGNGIHISIAAKNVEQGETFFNNLSAGGAVLMPYSDQFWGARFRMVKDKFGISWMVNCELKK
jgi:PhnB protein